MKFPPFRSLWFFTMLLSLVDSPISKRFLEKSPTSTVSKISFTKSIMKCMLIAYLSYLIVGTCYLLNWSSYQTEMTGSRFYPSTMDLAYKVTKIMHLVWNSVPPTILTHSSKKNKKNYTLHLRSMLITPAASFSDKQISGPRKTLESNLVVLWQKQAAGSI
jgi:hypothetical protein